MNTQKKRGMAALPADDFELEQLQYLLNSKQVENDAPVDIETSVDIETGQRIHEVVKTIDSQIAERTLTGKLNAFRQDGRLVVIAKGEHGIPRIVALSNDSFPFYISPFLRFYSLKKNQKDGIYEEYLGACPQNIAKSFLAVESDTAIPPLNGIVSSPTIRQDGTIISAQGYDVKSGLFLSLNEEFPQIPESPSKEDAKAALHRLQYVIKDFPFVDSASESVVLAGFLTSVIRRSLPSSPAFGITAPTMGTGKSLLSDLISIIGTGQQAQCSSLPFEESEVEKRLLSMLMAGAPILALDNIETHVRSSSLCTILTQPVFKARILGISRETAVPTNILVIINGNNLVIQGDMTTRVVLATLDAQQERPQSRQFDVNPKEYMIQNRAMMVMDCLTIISAYLGSGEKIGIEPFGRFEKWSQFIREPLVWLGCADPLDTVADIEKNDPVRLINTEVLVALHKCWGDKTFFARECVEELVYSQTDHYKNRRELLEVLESAVHSPRGLNGRTCGQFFQRLEKRIYDGMRLVSCGTYNRSVQWKVELMSLQLPNS